MTAGSNPDGRGKVLTELSLTPGLSRLVEEAPDTKYAPDLSACFHTLRYRWEPPLSSKETVDEIKITMNEIEWLLTPAGAGGIGTVALATCMHFVVLDAPKRV